MKIFFPNNFLNELNKCEISNIENNYPKGFQILCHNCNVAKGLIGNNNTCTHETIRLEQTFDDMTAQSSFEL